MGFKIEIALLVALPIVLVGLGWLLTRVMGKRIANHYNRWKTTRIRKKNPCYRCPRSRKYVCDGCFHQLRKEYENGRRFRNYAPGEDGDS